MSTINFVGNLTDTPSLNYGKTSGKPWARFRVGENRREQRDGQWVDAPTKFHNVLVFGAQAENIAESLDKGSHVLVLGEQRTRQYTPDGGTEAVKVDEVFADIVAPTLVYGTTEFTSVSRSSKPAESAPEYDEADVPPAEA